MTTFLGYDDDGITLAVIPRPCTACGILLDRLYLHLELDASVGADGSLDDMVKSMGRSPCCGASFPAYVPPIWLATAIEHVNSCSNHAREMPPTGEPAPGVRICYHPNARAEALGQTWKASCPDCPAIGYSGLHVPELVPWLLPPKR